jgi:2,3-dihydroxy-p-cumate/2,3-dihydroxybenzoate 3,4-dioxygenase
MVMISIEQLRYVRLGTPDLDRAVDFARRVVGLELVGRDDDQAWFRSDYRDHTLVFTAGDAADQTLGIEVRDQASLGAARAVLEGAGLVATAGDEAGRKARKVKDYITFMSPGGLRIDLALRPLQSGWRYFPARDAGITSFHGVAIRSTDIEGDERLWTAVLSGRVSDWVGDAAYIRIDDRHHRISLHPSTTGGLLEVQFEIEGLDQLMQNGYWLRSAQVKLLHGPGRQPTSGQIFLTFQGVDNVAFGYVAEGEHFAPDQPQRLPRQFAHARSSFCAWSSECAMIEYAAEGELT